MGVRLVVLFLYCFIGFIVLALGERTHYDVLNIRKSASMSAIKKAYRTLAKKYHPDKTKGDLKAQEKFIEVTKAYEVLSDENARKEYDYSLENPDPFHSHGHHFHNDRQNFQSFNDFSGMPPEEIIRMFGGNGNFQFRFHSGGKGGRFQQGFDPNQFFGHQQFFHQGFRPPQPSILEYVVSFLIQVAPYLIIFFLFNFLNAITAANRPQR